MPQEAPAPGGEARRRAACAAAKVADASEQAPVYHRLCGFIPTEQTSIDPILSVLRLEPDDVFYDLGCGDGRIVVSVVKHFRCRGIGIEVNRLLVVKARAQAEAELGSDP